MPLDGSLYVSPEPFPREAMTSWLLRTAAAHGCSWSRMRELIGLTDDEDADFTWPWELATSAQFLALPVDALAKLLSWSQSYVAQQRAFDLVMGTPTAPMFGVCGQCVREQNAMHYCVESRLNFIKLCPQHGTPLRLEGHEEVHAGRALQDLMSTRPGDLANVAVTARQQCEIRFALERRIGAAMKCGYERHPTMGMIPVQTLLAAEDWRLRPRRLADRSQFSI